jgi:hypothetical protein
MKTLLGWMYEMDYKLATLFEIWLGWKLQMQRLGGER